MKSVLTGLPLQRPSASNAKITTRGEKNQQQQKEFMPYIF